MQRMAADSGVFSLIRALPLLDVMASPIESEVREVVESSLAGKPVSPSVLEKLDDYREAGFACDGAVNSVKVQTWAATAAILVSEAQWPRYYLTQKSADSAVETMWQVIDEHLARSRGVSAVSMSGSGFAQRERSWRVIDERVIALCDVDHSALVRHLDLLRERFSEARSELIDALKDIGFEPCGPCAKNCDWPECQAEVKECGRFRRRQQTLGAELRRREGGRAEIWYLQAGFLENSNDEPYETLAEIGEDGFERRKVAYYDDGTIRSESVNDKVRTDVLSETPIPSFVHLKARKGMWVEEMTRQHFEQRWDEAKSNPVRGFLAE